jgi:hypothetical protein
VNAVSPSARSLVVGFSVDLETSRNLLPAVAAQLHSATATRSRTSRGRSVRSPINPYTVSDAACGDAHGGRAFERGAVLRHRRPVDHSITGSAMPAGMPAAAVSQAGDVADEDLVRAEAVGASGRWLGDPLPPCCADQLALVHLQQPMAGNRNRAVDRSLLD